MKWQCKLYNLLGSAAVFVSLNKSSCATVAEFRTPLDLFGGWSPRLEFKTSKMWVALQPTTAAALKLTFLVSKVFFEFLQLVQELIQELLQRPDVSLSSHPFLDFLKYRLHPQHPVQLLLNLFG